MNKPDALRAYLTAALPDLEREPERLQVFIDAGKVIATGGRTLGFEYRYRLNLLFLDFAGHPDEIFVPLLIWLRDSERSLLQSFVSSGEGVRFEAEILDSGKADISVDLDLSEAVRVTRDGGGDLVVTHVAEPAEDPGFGPEPGYWQDTIYDPSGLQQLKLGDLVLFGSPEP